MTLIIEDGSIVANANSFVTVAELDSYTSARGITLYQEDGTTELTSDQKEYVLIGGFDYLNSIDPQLKGCRVERAQTGAYPRVGLVIDGFTYDSNEIPSVVKTVQMSLAVESNQGVDLYSDQATIKSESVGIGNGAVTESKEYQGGKVEEIRQSNLLLRKLKGGSGYSMRVYR